MHEALFFALTIAIAAVGGFIGNKIKLPAGGMLGAMAAVIAFNLTVQPPIVVPDGIRIVLQLSFGPLLGARIGKEDLLGLRKLAFPAVVMVFCMLLMNIFIGTMIYLMSTLDIATTLFASAPGGMMDMAIISADFGANSAYVALLQLSRLLFIFICMIPFYKKLMEKLAKKAAKAEPEPKTAQETLLPEGRPPDPQGFARQAERFGITFLCGSVLGLLFWQIGVPAGAIIGAMLGSALYNIWSAKAFFPPGLRLPLQIIAGTFIGMRMDRESLFAMNEIIIPVIILFFGVILMTVITSFLMHKIAKLDLFTSVLASTPGGLSEMSLLADDLGANAPKVAVLHMARLISVIVFFPTTLALVLRIIEIFY